MVPSSTYLDSEGSADETGVVAKGSNAPARLILQELEVIQGASSAGKPGQDLLPAALLLVAMCKVYKSLLEGEFVFGQLLEANDDAVVLGRVLVCAFLDEGCACLFEFLILEDAGIVGVFG